MASPLERRAVRGGLPPRPPMMNRLPGSASGRRAGLPGPNDFSPVAWTQYFTESKDIEVGTSRFRIYSVGVSGPVLLLLHGGGFSALSWACFSAAVTRLVDCRCVAIDLRGHGDSATDDDANLAEETLSKDIADIVNKLFGPQLPAIIIMGHSMGGAIAIHVTKKQLIPSIIGLVVIDVVEGTALEALTNMQSFLRGRPKNFVSPEKAIEWAVKTGHIRNRDSARVSMMGQLKRASGETATHELETSSVVQPLSALSEDTEEEEEKSIKNNCVCKKDVSTNMGSENKVSVPGYVWRIDLSRTEPYWQGWFSGMSQLFLACSVPKLLLLAGVDRLDKDLTIGQMQGKFQMQVLPKSGHAVQEDAPDKVAESVASFLVRNKFAEPTADFNKPFPGC